MQENIKVLWLCNVTFSNDNPNSTGTWLHAMSHALANTGKIELYNITQSGVEETTRQNSGAINQWLVPFKFSKKNGLPHLNIIQDIQKIVDEIQPDIIQIWGTENYWGLLSARGHIKGNIILEIQGLKFAIKDYFFYGLSLLDIIKCFGIKEFLKPSGSLLGQRQAFKQWGIFEKEMLLHHKIISTQSEWVRAHVRNINPNAQLLKTCISLRAEFIKAKKWDIANSVPYQIFTTFSSVASYKGLHILLDAIALLKKQHPLVTLYIAGHISTGLRQDGYTKWLLKKIKQLGINENIFWLGSLDAKNLIQQMHKANVVVVPSFIESYSLALDESLTIGVPTVASFSGAMPELATHEKTALYFTPGDVIMCANAIERFFVDKSYATHISCNAFEDKITKRNTDLGLSQLAIYRLILETN